MGRATRWLKSLLAGKRVQNAAVASVDERLEKKRWSFGKAVRDSSDRGTRARATSAEEAAWLSSLYDENEREEQSRHAVAVAAATAAAADAAVAAAQAAVAVVRLTSKGRRGSMFSVHERLAAVKIQTVFRGFLAKKALRALKALVKLQAMIRGHLVRKNAAKALHRIQALIRAQSTLRSQKSGNLDRRILAEIRPRRSLERFDDTRSEHIASLHSRRLSASSDRSPKIVEIDTGRPRSRSSRRTTSPSRFDTDDEPPANSATPARISIPECRSCRDHDWCHLRAAEKTRFASTAQSTPRYAGPSTPAAKSVIAAERELGRFMNAPGYRNYMSNTESFDAKVRSQSTPKQRPENSKRRVPLREMMAESRASLSGVGRIKDATYLRRAVVGRIDESLEMGRGAEVEYYLQRKW